MIDSRLTFRAFAEIIGLLAGAFGMIYMSRVVGPEYLGLSASASSLLMLVSRIADWGSTSLATQRLARDDLSLSTLLSITLPPKVVFSAFLIGCTLLIVKLMHIDPRLGYFISISVFVVFFDSCSPAWVFVALGKVNTASLIRILQSVFYAGIIVLTIRNQNDWVGIPKVMLANSILNFSLACFFLYRGKLLNFDVSQFNSGYFNNVKLFFLEARHYLKADLSLYMYTSSDRLILYYFTTPYFVGIYEAAYKIINPFYAISSIVTPTLFRSLAQSFKKGSINSVMPRFVYFMLLFTIPLGFFLFYFAENVISLVYGDRFVESVPSLIILGFAITAGYAAGTIVIPFSAWNMPGEYGRAMFFGNILNMLLNVLLIPCLGAAGAALSTLAAKFAVGVTAYIYFKKVTTYPILKDFACFAAAALAPMMLVAVISPFIANKGFLMIGYVAIYGVLAAVIYKTYFVSRWDDMS